MKLISVYTPSHEILKDKWFLPSLRDDYELEIYPFDIQGDGKYLTPDWTRGVSFKAERIIEAIKQNWGQVIVYSDIDIQFFRPTKSVLLDAIGGYDIVCQQNDSLGQLCTGFWIAEANARTLALWESVRECVKKEGRDQLAFNRLIRKEGMAGLCRYASLPAKFFCPGIVERKLWKPGNTFPIPKNIILHHANWTEGIENKIAQLEYVKKSVQS